VGRRHVDSVVAGVVLGAVVGLGFNLTESVEYMGDLNGAAGFNYWMRQSVGLFGSHVAFSAVAGAGSCRPAARDAPRTSDRDRLRSARRLRRTPGSNVLLSWFGRVHGQWFTAGETVTFSSSSR